jgi:hypothetical protein
MDDFKIVMQRMEFVYHTYIEEELAPLKATATLSQVEAAVTNQFEESILEGFNIYSLIQ